MSGVSINIPKAGFAVFLFGYGVYCVIRPTEWHLIDGVNLVAHEAGHLLLGWFGQFIGILGGTIGQLFVPAAFTVYFLLQGSPYSSAVTLFWLGQSVINVSVYIKDSRALELPLVSIGGGGDTIHDWHWLLSKFGLLALDQMIGTICFGIGVLIMLGALVVVFACSRGRESGDEIT